MPSPFPGMDPYLERHWLDVHTKVITYAADELNRRLPPDLIARAEERMAIELPPAEPGGPRQTRPLAPDVRIFEGVGDGFRPDGAGGGVALAPYRLELIGEPVTERFIEIIDVRGGERLITVIEFVSPTNKSGDGLEQFARKRRELIAGGVNLVEIDLVRAGDAAAFLYPYTAPPEAVSAYRAIIRVAGDREGGYLHPIDLREPLPVVRIPLRDDEPPAELPLQPLIADAYENGRYGRTIDYRRPCVPPLAGDDAAWADALLRAAGRRS